MPDGAAFNVLIPATGADVFVHTATAANSAFNYTVIDHPLTNDNPNAIVFITQNYNPGGLGGKYNDQPIGVKYSSMAQKWAVFNQDTTADMPVDAAFNVLIPPTGTDVFVHAATADNTSGHVTYINHPRINENPNAMVLVTQNWNPGGVGGTYNDHAIGVYYSGGAKKWAIFNQDFANMPDGAAFNVSIPTTGAAAVVHMAMVANTSGHITFIDHPLTNENPNAIVLVTQNWNPGGGKIGVYNNHAIGVYYASGAQKWAVFNQDFAGMPDGAAFNVLIPAVDTSVFVHIARAGNINGHYTYIDHPLTNNDPDAIVLVTQNYNPSGVGGEYNDQPIGVWYSSTAQKWAVFNQDNLTAMPVDAAFNVLIPATDPAVFVHTATATNSTENLTVIDHALTNDNPNAIVFVTQNFNPGGVGGKYNDQPIGVWYSSAAQKWAVFNQDHTTDMPVDAAFNVIVFVKIYLPIILR